MSWLSRLRRTFTGEKARPAHLVTGEWGERKAARFLKKQGFKILGRNIRFGKTEEIDIVMRDAKTLVFVEVKTRAANSLVRPVAAVTHSKRKSLRRAANSYLSRLKNVDRKTLSYRFDVVEVVGTPSQKGQPEIRHIKRAFAIHARD